MIVMKLMHFRNGVCDGFMLDGDPVGGDHGSRAIGAALAMNKNLRLRISANQIEELNDLRTRRILPAAPRDADVLHSEGLDLFLFVRSFSSLVTEIDDNPHAHIPQLGEPGR